MFRSSTVVKRSVVDVLIMFVVCCFSLSTLVYVAQGDGDRTYREFYRGAAYAQGQLLQNALQSFARLDLPLRQFAGFNALAQPLLANGSAIAQVKISDDHGRTIFVSAMDPPKDANAIGKHAADPIDNGGQATGKVEQIIFPIQNKFETVGNLVLEIRPEIISRRIQADFRPLWILVLLASSGFALLTLWTAGRSWERKRVMTAAAFVGTFTVVACAVTFTLLNLYTDGASAKGRALLTSLSGRLDDVPAAKIDFDQIGGIDHLFDQYRRLNPDISTIVLLVDGMVKFQTGLSASNVPWTPPERAFEHVADISGKGNLRSIKIAITMPRNVVYRQISECIRSILALFIASGLLAYFSMSVARSLQEAREDKLLKEKKASEFGLGLIKPVFFLATFIENLNYSFLPQHVLTAAKASGVSPSFVSLPFILFYFFFAASLIPAERMERRCGPHKLILAGLTLVAVGLLTLAGEFGFYSIVLARALSGVGQGLVFIGVQSYILNATTLETRTRGASIIVIGFQGGMMSGMAIGSLLVSQLGHTGVFELGAIIAAVTGLYTWGILPSLDAGARFPEPNRQHVWRNIMLTLRDPQFSRAIWFIGLPAKAVLTGVLLFALPLLLVKQGYRQEDVGQITMAYGASVIAASAFVSARKSRRHRGTGGILVCGAFLSGVGLLLMSAAGPTLGGFGLGQIVPAASVIVAGAIIVGLGHGFINAPVITQVSEARVSGQLGVGPVVATYRLLERAGHTAGPMVVGQVFMLAGSGSMALGWIGGALIVLGLFFAVSLDVDSGSRVEPETV